MNCLKISCLILLLLPLPSTSENLNLTLRDWNLNVKRRGKSIDLAIKEYFLTKTCRLSVSIHLEYSKHWQTDIFNYLGDVLKDSEYMKFQIYINGFGDVANKRSYYNNLWYVDSYVGFRSLLPDMQVYERIGKYMVVMATAKNLDPKQELQMIFQHAYKINIFDIVVAVYEGKKRFILYSYDFFRPGKCRQVVLEQVNTFQNGKFDSSDLFPYKSRNLHKCLLTIHVRRVIPYFNYTVASDGTQIDQYRGLEAKIIDTMKERLNFDLRLYYRDGRLTGTVYDNGSSTGPFRMLQSKQLDIVLGYYNSMARWRYYRGSSPYLIVPVVVVFHERPKLIIEGWWLLDAFQRPVWHLIFFVVGLSMASVHYAHYKSRKNIRFPVNVTWLDMLGLTLGSSRPLKFHYFSTKYASLMWAIGFMIFCAIFQGKLCDAFNRRFAPRIDRLQKLIDSNTTFILGDIQEKDIVDALQLPSHLILYHEFPMGDVIYEDLRNYPDNAATIANYWQFQSYVNRYRRYGEFGMLPSAVVYNQLCAYMRHHSYLNEPITRLINNLNSGGILTKWIKDATAYETYNDISRMNQQLLDPQPLPMVKIRIVFMGMAIMYIASIMIFVGEILYKRLKK